MFTSSVATVPFVLWTDFETSRVSCWVYYYDNGRQILRLSDTHALFLCLIYDAGRTSSQDSVNNDPSPASISLICQLISSGTAFFQPLEFPWTLRLLFVKDLWGSRFIMTCTRHRTPLILNHLSIERKYRRTRSILTLKVGTCAISSAAEVSFMRTPSIYLSKSILAKKLVHFKTAHLSHSSQVEPFHHSSQEQPFHHSSQEQPFHHSSQEEQFHHSSQEEPFHHSSQEEPFHHSSQEEPFHHSSQEEQFHHSSQEEPFHHSSQEEAIPPFILRAAIPPFISSGAIPPFQETQTNIISCLFNVHVDRFSWVQLKRTRQSVGWAV